MSIEAMEQALEALIQIRTPLRVNTSLDAYYVGRAITSLRQAIAEAEKQEPVSECVDDGEGGVYYKTLALNPPIGLLYTHPQPKHEPLLVFAKECVLGAYRESELADAAQRAINAAERNK